MRLTVAQALIRFLSVQYSERDGVEQRLIPGCFGIFGHGNVAGVGQALLEEPDAMPFYHARNEQGMVHAAIGYARMKNRLSTLACASSIGPGATNMVTGAALATISRLPVLLLPGDVFATRAPGTVLQELEDPRSYDVSVNDTLRPVSRYWDRVERPEQLVPALLRAMRVLTDPAETGAVTVCLPQDVQAEAYDWPEELFDKRVWRVRRPVPEAERARARPRRCIRGARTPLIVSGGGTIYAEATDALAAFAEATGIPVAETQAGKGSLPVRPPAVDGRDRRDRDDRRQRASRARPTWCSASARAGATSPPPRARSSPTTTSASSTSTSRRSTPSSTPALPLVADARRRARGADRGAGRCQLRDAARTTGTRWSSARTRSATAPLPGAERGDRRRQPRSAARATS